MPAGVWLFLSQCGQHLLHDTRLVRCNPHHLIQPFQQPFFLCLVIVLLVKNMNIQLPILFCIEQHTVRFLAIPTRSADLLVVIDDAQGQVKMDDQPDIRHIHTHAKRCGGHHNPFLPMDKVQLVLLSFLRVHICVAFDHLALELF